MTASSNRLTGLIEQRGRNASDLGHQETVGLKIVEIGANVGIEIRKRRGDNEKRFAGGESGKKLRDSSEASRP